MVFDGEGETPILEKATANKIVGIRPEHITLSDDKGIAAELLHADYLGSETIIDARISGQPILVRASGHIKLPKPIAARLSWRSENVHIFDAISGVRDDLSRAFDV